MTEFDLRKAILEHAQALNTDASSNQREHLNKIISLAEAFKILLK